VKTRFSILLSLAAIVLLAAAGVRVAGGHIAKAQRVERDSAVSRECAVVRAWLSGFFEDHGRYPDQLGDTVECNGEDFRLQHGEDLVYIPSDDRKSFELRWNMASEEGVAIYEKWENGVLAAQGRTEEPAP
jgi:hypothetical protein